jgi:YggT family protein
LKNILCDLLSLYLLVLVARAILSFFPIGPDSGLFGVQRALVMVTEPVLAPLRRVIPPLGMFDMSFLVLFIAIQVIHGTVLKCPAGPLGL